RRGVSASQAGARRPARRRAGAPAHAAEPVARGDLQRRRGADRDCWLCHAPDRRRGHVGLLDPGHGQCTARSPRPRRSSTSKRAAARCAGAERAAVMNALVYLVPMALLLGLTGLAAFLWSLRSGQYDDMEGAAIRILEDDDLERER